MVGARRGFTVPAGVSLTYLLTLGLSSEQEKQSVVLWKSRVSGEVIQRAGIFLSKNRVKEGGRDESD